MFNIYIKTRFACNLKIHKFIKGVRRKFSWVVFEKHKLKINKEIDYFRRYSLEHSEK